MALLIPWLFCLFYLFAQHVAAIPSIWSRTRCDINLVNDCMDNLSQLKVCSMSYKARISANNHTNTMLGMQYEHHLHSKDYICGPRDGPPVGSPTERDAPPDLIESPSVTLPAQTSTASSTNISSGATGIPSSSATQPPTPGASPDPCADHAACEKATRRMHEGMEAQQEILREQERNSKTLSNLLKQCEPRSTSPDLTRRSDNRQMGHQGQIQAWEQHLSACNTLRDAATAYRQYQETTLEQLKENQHSKRGDEFLPHKMPIMRKRGGPKVRQLNRELMDCQQAMAKEWLAAQSVFDQVTAKYEELAESTQPGPLVIPEPPVPEVGLLASREESQSTPYFKKDSGLAGEELGNILKTIERRGGKDSELITVATDYVAKLVADMTNMSAQLRKASQDRNHFGRENALCQYYKRHPKKDEAAKMEDIKVAEIAKLKEQHVKDVEDKVVILKQELQECKASKSNSTEI